MPYDPLRGDALREKYHLDVTSPQSIVDAVTAFTEDDWRRGFNFGHITLSDMNLERHFIQYCIECYEKGELLTDVDYSDAQEIDADCIAFLHELLKASDDVLEEAEVIYWGADD